MSLTVDTRNVENSKEVCYKKPKDGKRAYKDTTVYLAWGSMAIGIGEITYKNYPEVYARHKFLNKLVSSIPMIITLEDVRNHIGLKTNVTLEKLPKWRNRIASSEWSSIKYNVDEKVNDINKLGGTK